MLTVITLLKVKPSPNGEQHGERPFWREFGERYLDAWLRNVERYVPGSWAVVMTDAPEIALRAGANDAIRLDKTVDAPGFWAKLNMFRPEVSQGKCLYLDLDNVLCGDISELCALTPDPLVMLDDRRVPGLPNGSAILFDAERCRDIWTNYVANQDFTHKVYVARDEDYTKAYDQAYIARWARYNLSFFQDLLPDGYILNSRSELPHVADWRSARLIFGGGVEGKPHLSTHPAFALR